MRISGNGGVIAAATGGKAKPMLRMGGIPIVQRLVLTFQQAGIFPIVVVTGVQADDVKYQLAGRGVVFLHNEQYRKTTLLESARMGFDFLHNACGRIVFTPVNAPLVTPAALRLLLASRADVAVLSHGGKGGHPVSLSGRAAALASRDAGAKTLRDAMANLDLPREWVDTDDVGVVLNIRDEKRMRDHISRHSRDYFHPYLRISLENEEDLFSPRLKTLLFLVMKTRSVARARELVALSNSTAWEMINRLEDALGYRLVARSKGGVEGSRSDLTRRGVAFLAAWQRYEESVRHHADSRFGRFARAFLHGTDDVEQ